MRCIAVCPKHARSLNKVVLFAAEKKMAKLFETRKENELFLGEANDGQQKSYRKKRNEPGHD